MKNNNQAVVRKIARKSLASSRGRNIFLVLAIFLTTFMLGTIISLSVSYMESQNIFLLRLFGTPSHATITGVTENQIEQIKNLDYVSVYSVSINAADVQDGGYLNGETVILEWCDDVEWETFIKPAISNIAGSYPKNYDEIMVPSHILENMGINKPTIGMDITITYQINENSPQTQTFKLSGYYKSYAYLRFGDVERMYISQEFIEKSGCAVEDSRSIQILFTDKKRSAEYSERFIKDTELLLYGSTASISTRIFSEKTTDGIYYVFAVIAVFLIIAGFLIIYNIMSVSVSRDIRFYGLMKTIGMTPKQIRNTVLQQILRLCAVGIPAGLLFSGLVSFIVVPWFINTSSYDLMRAGGAAVSFNPLIFIGAAVVALLTALLGAFNPARKATEISPIESVRFSEYGYERENVRSSKFNSLKVAWRNVFRIPKRAFLVFCSMFIGMTMFLLVTTILGSTDMDVYVELSTANIDGDIYLINRMPDYAMAYNLDNLQAFTPELMERLNSLPGLTDMDIRYARKILTDSGYLDMEGNPYYRTDFVYESDESEESVIYDIALYIEKDAQKQALGMIKEWTKSNQYIQYRSGIEIRGETEQLKNTLMIMGGSISAILWFIGILNFINIISTNILTRRHELALLESIGQSKKQSKKMLTAEGIVYAVITLLLVCILGGLITYGLFLLIAAEFDYAIFSFPYIPLIVMTFVVFSICLIIPQIVYRSVSKLTIVERLREVE